MLVDQREWCTEQDVGGSERVVCRSICWWIRESGAQIKMLVDQRFEYQHSGSTQNNDLSIFKSMEILMSDRAHLPDNYMSQSDFMEMIKLAIREYAEAQAK